jgi:hypothetical protein
LTNVKDFKSPIPVAPKPKCGKRLRNVFYDNRGFPNQSDEFDHIMHNIDGGVILCKKKHPQQNLDVDDPLFNYKFDEALHAVKIKSKLSIGHLLPADAAEVVDLIIKYWSVFDKRGTFTPIVDYKCVIDTGTATPIAIKKIDYGTRKTPIICKCIAALEKVGQIVQIHDGHWLFKALLAVKSHQEHILEIEDFVWHFCVNNIPLN